MAWAAGWWIQARLAQRYPPERFAPVGFVVTVVGLAMFGAVLLPSSRTARPLR